MATKTKKTGSKKLRKSTKLSTLKPLSRGSRYEY